jgi:rhomboid protease GluP
MFEADGIYLKMYGPRNGVPLSIRNTRFLQGIKLNWQRIVDVEVQGNAIRLGYQVPGAADAGIDLWFPNEAVAAQIAAVLPKRRTEGFQPLLSADVEYQSQLQHRPPKSAATLTLLAANVLLFIGAVLGGAGLFIPHAPIEIAAGANFGPLTLHGQWWRLISALFVHFGILHLAFNMWALAAFGGLAERLFGIRIFLGVYFASGIVANLASVALHPNVASAGASGAIFGVLGALIAAYWRKRKTLPYTIVRSERFAAVVFAVIALLAGFAHKGLDNVAHLAGLAIGLLWGAAWLRAKRNRVQSAVVSQLE